MSILKSLIHVRGIKRDKNFKKSQADLLSIMLIFTGIVFLIMCSLFIVTKERIYDNTHKKIYEDKINEINNSNDLKHYNVLLLFPDKGIMFEEEINSKYWNKLTNQEYKEYLEKTETLTPSNYEEYSIHAYNCIQKFIWRSEYSDPIWGYEPSNNDFKSYIEILNDNNTFDGKELDLKSFNDLLAQYDETSNLPIYVYIHNYEIIYEDVITINYIIILGAFISIGIIVSGIYLAIKNKKRG